MAEKLTLQQKQAVENRGGPLLVSAAAGSGKTKVLVDRLLKYLNDPVDPADIDEFLIITYTKAAAGELRGKIAAKLTEQIALTPENRHLQQQMQRLYLAKISTVHAFCTDLLREYAYRLDISADFRVADEDECFEMQTRVMEQLLNHAYDHAAENPDFCALIDSQGLGRDDRQIPEIILKVYNSARCHLNPQQWLQWCAAVGDCSDQIDAAQTIWGAYLMEDLKTHLALQISALETCIQRAKASDGMEKPVLLLMDTVNQLRVLYECSQWDAICRHKDIDYGRLTFPRGPADTELIGQIKAVRESCKKTLTKKLRNFSDDSAQILFDMKQANRAARGLVGLVCGFDKAYCNLKRNKRVLDFGDLEHLTLDLLMGKQRSGPTAIAREVGKRFREVMVDEYQDSNSVQDAIFSCLTKENGNCFMVGDVKQSIYQFRLADPGIFLEKYQKYSHAVDALDGEGRKIMLSSNFRSSGGIISATNDVFVTCMSQAVGGLTYGKDETLYEGIPHIPLNEPELELYGIDVQEDTYLEEANFVAKRISELTNGSHMVRQGDLLRPIVPEDIVILLRSPGSVGEQFQNALSRYGIRCASGGNADILRSEEIQVLRGILQIISNPLQDIPLLAVLSSKVFRFTADELAYIRSKNQYRCFYDAMKECELERVTKFLQLLDTLRNVARMNSLSNLLNYVLSYTRLDSLYGAMVDGASRLENIQAFIRLAAGYENGSGSLNRFLAHLEVLDERGLISPGEINNTKAVTIMSIHKSKGLEFPVVFLCGLSRDFNKESVRAQVLCDRHLGLGLCGVDSVNRVRYPTLAKRAIAAKITAEGISEEMRVLYVAMTRARDRLIMTYASGHLETELTSIVQRMDISHPLLMTADVDCPGKWVLLTALRRQEATAFFALSGRPEQTYIKEPLWRIGVVQGDAFESESLLQEKKQDSVTDEAAQLLRDALSFVYPHAGATCTPSKQTATQIKGRWKDQEAAEQAETHRIVRRQWKKPSFVEQKNDGVTRGKAMHAVMQYLPYNQCTDIEHINYEIMTLVRRGYLTEVQAQLVDTEQIAAFFATDMGQKLKNSQNVLREFKFSILDDAQKYNEEVSGERILLQGVVDCAILETDGITVLDFKTDRINQEQLADTVDGYRGQIMSYADALSRIYKLPVNSAQLYFFALNCFVDVLL